ncbi:hypothetical protein BKA57DRAFT_462785 [Linnemannia elongata]|nr:hypothetical protein BKA57DRAFT_462785 [Linnemannia elongata]
MSSQLSRWSLLMQVHSCVLPFLLARSRKCAVSLFWLVSLPPGYLSVCPSALLSLPAVELDWPSCLPTKRKKLVRGPFLCLWVTHLLFVVCCCCCCLLRSLFVAQHSPRTGYTGSRLVGR